MRNIDRIRAMDADQLADFLVESGAEVPTEFCDILCSSFQKISWLGTYSCISGSG